MGMTRDKLRRVRAVLRGDITQIPMRVRPAGGSFSKFGQQTWLAEPTIVGLGSGMKETAGKPLDILALRVYVSRKLPESELDNPFPNELLVPGIDQPVPVDICEIGELVAHQWMHGTHQPPIRSGDAVGASTVPPLDGTLGCFVSPVSAPDRVYLMSCSHVLASSGRAEFADVYQPGRNLDSGSPRVAGLGTSSFIMFGEGYPNETDVAFAEVEPVISWQRRGRTTPAPTGVRAASFRTDAKVRIMGARSGEQAGRVIDPDADIWITLPDGLGRAGFRHQVLANYWSEEGDSGALVLDSGDRAAGIHIAGGTSETGLNTAAFTPIATIFGRHDIQLASEHALKRDSVRNELARVSEDDLENNLLKTPRWHLYLHELTVPHRAWESDDDGVAWHLSPRGIRLGDELPVTVGPPVTIARIWERYGRLIRSASESYEVPIELILATVATESRGRSNASFQEGGFVDIDSTPDEISLGLMQTLVTTARWILDRPDLPARALLDPQVSIEAGVAYIAHQFESEPTRFDPPKVACAYNAGSLRHSRSNRWRMVQTALPGRPSHADRFVEWFNDCFRYFSHGGQASKISFYVALNN